MKQKDATVINILKQVKWEWKNITDFINNNFHILMQKVVKKKKKTKAFCKILKIEKRVADEFKL